MSNIRTCQILMPPGQLLNWSVFFLKELCPQLEVYSEVFFDVNEFLSKKEPSKGVTFTSLPSKLNNGDFVILPYGDINEGISMINNKINKLFPSGKRPINGKKWFADLDKMMKRVNVNFLSNFSQGREQASYFIATTLGDIFNVQDFFVKRTWGKMKNINISWAPGKL